MRERTQAQSGFSLIETTAVLLLVGILAAAASGAIIIFAQAFTTAVRSTELAGKMQSAMARLTHDFAVISDVSSGNGTALTYQSRNPTGTLEWHTLSWSGTSGASLMLDGQPLLGSVHSFVLTYLRQDNVGNELRSATWSAFSRGIEAAITVTQSPNRPYVVRVYARNL